MYMDLSHSGCIVLSKSEESCLPHPLYLNSPFKPFLKSFSSFVNQLVSLFLLFFCFNGSTHFFLHVSLWYFIWLYLHFPFYNIIIFIFWLPVWGANPWALKLYWLCFPFSLFLFVLFFQTMRSRALLRRLINKTHGAPGSQAAQCLAPIFPSILPTQTRTEPCCAVTGGAMRHPLPISRELSVNNLFKGGLWGDSNKMSDSFFKGWGCQVAW